MIKMKIQSLWDLACDPDKIIVYIQMLKRVVKSLGLKKKQKKNFQDSKRQRSFNGAALLVNSMSLFFTFKVKGFAPRTDAKVKNTSPLVLTDPRSPTVGITRTPIREAMRGGH